MAGIEQDIQETIIRSKLKELERIINKKKKSNKIIRYIYFYNHQILVETKAKIREVYQQSLSFSAPRSIFATCLYLACNYNSYYIDQVRVAKLFNSNAVSIRNNIKKLLTEEENRELRKIRSSHRKNSIQITVRT